MDLTTFIAAFGAAKSAGLSPADFAEALKAFQAFKAVSAPVPVSVPAPTPKPAPAPDYIRITAIPVRQREAIIRLADRDPDGATRQNKVGFSRLTGPKGHILADLFLSGREYIPATFKATDHRGRVRTVSTVQDTAWICNHHRKQIRRMGL